MSTDSLKYSSGAFYEYFGVILGSTAMLGHIQGTSDIQFSET